MKKNGCVYRTLSLLMSFVVCVSVIALSIPITSKAASDFQIIKAIKTYKSSFDSGIVLNDNYFVEMCFSLDGLDQYSNVFEMGNTIVLRNESTRGLYARYGWYNDALYKPVNKGINIVKLHGNVFTINNSAVLKASKQNLNYNTTLKFGAFNGQISYVTIKNSNQVPVADFYAATDANGKAGMYDTISGKFIYSSKECAAIAGENEYFKGTINTTKDPDIEKSNSNTEQGTKDSTEKADANKEKEQNEDSSTTEKEEPDRQQTTALKAVEINNGIFNTGILINQDNSYEMIFEMSNTAVYRDIVTSSPYILRIESSKGLYVRHGWANEPVYKIKQNTAIDYLQKKNEAYVNGTRTMKLTKQTIAGAKKLTFGNFQGKIEVFKIFDSSNKLIAEFLPVLDANGVACMEETISGNLVYCSNECKAVYGSSLKSVSKPQPASNNTEVVDEVVKEEVVKVTLTREEEVRRDIIRAIETGDGSVQDISKYGFNSFKVVGDIYEDVIRNECRIAFNSTANMSIEVSNENGKVDKFRIGAMDSGYLNRYATMKKLVNEIKQKTLGMTDLQKIVYIHDYVAFNTVYSTSGTLKNSAAGALLEGRALCAGYARAMALLLNEVGVEAEYVSPLEMSHAWCRVKLDGQWYYADPCWDDPGKNNIEVAHKYLLRNEKEFSKFGYKGLKGNMCTSNRFENWSIHDVMDRIDYNGSYWFYIDKTTHKEVKIEL